MGQQTSVKKDVQHLTLEAKLSMHTNTDRVSLMQHILKETVKIALFSLRKICFMLIVALLQYSKSLRNFIIGQFSSDNIIVKFQPIVACTCLGVSTNLLFSYRRFSMTVVDEASLVLEPTIIPAIAASDSFVLVGDHRQLIPLVCSTQARYFAHLTASTILYEIKLS